LVRSEDFGNLAAADSANVSNPADAVSKTQPSGLLFVGREQYLCALRRFFSHAQGIAKAFVEGLFIQEF
jgi:hypothetical protein